MIGQVNQAPVGDLTTLATTAKSSAVAAINELEALIGAGSIVFDTYNRVVAVGAYFGMRRRWVKADWLSAISGDADNPYENGVTLRHHADVLTEPFGSGKVVWLDEIGLTVGDRVQFGICFKATATEIWKVAVKTYSAAGALLASSLTNAAAGTGAPQTAFSAVVTIATGAENGYLEVMLIRTGNAYSDVDIYAIWGQPSAATPEPIDSLVPINFDPNIVFDSCNVNVPPGFDFDDRPRWIWDRYLTAIYGDADNPYGGVTLRYSGLALNPWLVGKIVYLSDFPWTVGQAIIFAMCYKSEIAEPQRMYVALHDAAGTLITSTVTDKIESTGAAQIIYSVPLIIPSGATDGHIRVGIQRGEETSISDIDIYAIWSGGNGAPGATGNFANTSAPSAMQPLGFGAAAATIESTGAGTAVVAVIGDSWCQLWQFPHVLRDYLQAAYGNAGYGWVSAAAVQNAIGSQPTAIRTNTGTWTDTDQAPAGDGSAMGPDLTHCKSVDPAASMTFNNIAVQAIDLYYRTQAGGGSFRWRIDSGSWTTVDTNAAPALAKVVITGLSNAIHVLVVEMVDPATNGIILLGIDMKLTAPGVRVHKLGNGYSHSGDWIAVDATTWQSAITALAPNVVCILTGTNDQGYGVAPSTYYSNLQTLIARIRTAAPTADICLISSGDNDRTTIDMAHYNSQMRRLARYNRCMFVSGYDFFGRYTEIVARGLYQDHLHPTGIGLRMLAKLVADRLLYWSQ